MQSEICKVLSNPKRLQILHELRDEELTVGELASRVGLRQANVSQHLALMRHRKIVVERRQGNTVHYRLADPRIVQACDIMQDLLVHQVREESNIVQRATALLRS